MENTKRWHTVIDALRRELVDGRGRVGGGEVDISVLDLALVVVKCNRCLLGADGDRGETALGIENRLRPPKTSFSH